ncbi:hypothetical protein BCR35DRAFT_301840 [Leucosporidium creatinivorum]|uniref:F-box domain-containing protein n=1 Tax=Leucosporidium creatinivorum TaxID=106004 RepID=A0A1Y2FXQ3_9BASI|nr:hypothetical protein BCR35DRAFT_301840 [Leucosporidium creatinivorum]
MLCVLAPHHSLLSSPATLPLNPRPAPKSLAPSLVASKRSTPAADLSTKASDTVPPVRKDLPEDCIYEILAHVLALTRTEATRTLVALSLVSSAWRDPSQRLLFRQPHLPSSTYKHRTHFNSTLTTYSRMLLLKNTLEAHPHLASSVQSLAFGPWSTAVKQEATHDRPSGSKLAIDLLRLVPTLCPQLRALSWPGVVISDKVDASSALQRLPPTIETLHLGDGSSDRDMDLALKYLDPALRREFGSARWSVGEVGAVLARWPSLRKVVLMETLLSRGEDEWGLSAESARWSCELEEFELALGGQSVLALGDLERILGGSRDSLRRLSITEHQLHPQVLINYLTSSGSALTHLSTTTNALHSSPLLLSAVASSCASLRHLSLGSFLNLSDALQPLSRLRHLETLSLKTVSTLVSQPTELLKTIARDLRGFARLKKVYLEVSSDYGRGFGREVTVERRVWRGGRWLDWAEREMRMEGDIEVELRYYKR